MSKRKTFAWVLLVGSVIGWPVTALTVAKDEPFYILGLSWMAIIVTAIDIVMTAEVSDKQK